MRGFGVLTLILPESKMIGLCHQYRARPDSTSVQSDQTQCSWLAQIQVLTLISLKRKWTVPKLKVDYSVYEIRQVKG